MKIIDKLKIRNIIIKISIGIVLWFRGETHKMVGQCQLDQVRTKCMLFKSNFI